MDETAAMVGFVTFCVVLAGCTATMVPNDEGPTQSPSAPATSTIEDRPEPGTLVVALDGSSNEWRDFRSLVDQATQYWERNGTEHLGRSVGFVIRAESRDSDVVVRFVDRVDRCGPTASGVGYTTGSVVADRSPEPATVCVRNGYTDAATQRILVHEFGHLLGLDHDDGPAVMQPRREFHRLPVPDRALQETVWNRSVVHVFVDFEGVYALRRYRAHHQIESLLAYYNAGAGGQIPGNVSFTRADNRSSADVLIEFPTISPCGEENWGSCGRLRTQDSLTSQPSQLTITVTNIHREAIGWHVGYWLGVVFTTEHSGLPRPFREASYDDRRSAWWID